MKNSLVWEFHSGGSVSLFPPSRTTYEVRWRDGVTKFADAGDAESFFAGIEPLSLGESKALWEIRGGAFPELVECRVAEAPDERK